MDATTIIEMDAQGKPTYWTPRQFERVLEAHGMPLESLTEDECYEIDAKASRFGGSRYDAAVVLLWLGY